jgi:hypothetical protein
MNSFMGGIIQANLIAVDVVWAAESTIFKERAMLFWKDVMAIGFANSNVTWATDSEFSASDCFVN